jgi:hypothetical protein
MSWLLSNFLKEVVVFDKKKLYHSAKRTITDGQQSLFFDPEDGYWEKVRSKKYKQSKGYGGHNFDLKSAKPVGLWYGFGDSWSRYVADIPQLKGIMTYEIDLGSSKIAKLKSKKDVENFTNEFPNDEVPSMFVDWTKVAKKYDGVQIKPYDRFWGDRFMWVSGWDVESGCVWNLSKVKAKRIE